MTIHFGNAAYGLFIAGNKKSKRIASIYLIAQTQQFIKKQNKEIVAQATWISKSHGTSYVFLLDPSH
jgi:hypothetical protein